jgi:hypothetical protein
MGEEQESSRGGDDLDTASARTRRRFDWTETKPSRAVVDVVATALEVAPTEIEPLYNAVDPDALDRIVVDPVGDRDTAAVEVSFTFADREVTVEGAGAVVVEPVDVG